MADTDQAPADHQAPAPRLLTLRADDFDAACAALMRLVERDYAPSLLVGVRTGGMVVAEAMARAAAIAPSVLPLTCRRQGTSVKSRIPGLRTILTALPQPLVDALRQTEHRLLSGRRRRARPAEADLAEATAIGEWLAGMPPQRVLVADDAVDSGVTLAAVLQALRQVCPSGTELRTAVITVTLQDPVVAPDYALHRGVLCRFPWSFDAAA